MKPTMPRLPGLPDSNPLARELEPPSSKLSCFVVAAAKESGWDVHFVIPGLGNRATSSKSVVSDNDCEHKTPEYTSQKTCDLLH